MTTKKTNKNPIIKKVTLKNLYPAKHKKIPKAITKMDNQVLFFKSQGYKAERDTLGQPKKNII